MAIKLTAAEAKAASYKKVDAKALRNRDKGVTFDKPQVDYICYIGPCEPGTGYREVCYHTDTGCDDCYLEEDPVCS